jgi:hypothetical protein
VFSEKGKNIQNTVPGVGSLRELSVMLNAVRRLAENGAQLRVWVIDFKTLHLTSLYCQSTDVSS